MASITIKGIPEELHLRLKEQAKEHGRSLNQEIIQNLRVGISLYRPRDMTALDARNAESLRQQEKEGIWLTEDDVEAFINESRE